MDAITSAGEVLTRLTSEERNAFSTTLIRSASLDAIAANLLARIVYHKDNSVVDWAGIAETVDVSLLEQTFADRLKVRYLGNNPPKLTEEPRDNILHTLFVWVRIEGQSIHVRQYLRSQFQSDPAAIRKFIGWIIPEWSIEEFDSFELLFDYEELAALVESHWGELSSDSRVAEFLRRLKRSKQTSDDVPKMDEEVVPDTLPGAQS